MPKPDSIWYAGEWRSPAGVEAHRGHNRRLDQTQDGYEKHLRRNRAARRRKAEQIDNQRLAELRGEVPV